MTVAGGPTPVRTAALVTRPWRPRVPADPLSLESIVGLASDLIRIPSVNPAIAPDEAHGERAVASFACE